MRCFNCLNLTKMENPNYEWHLEPEAIWDPEHQAYLHINEAVTEAPHMINVPGPMGPVPMVVVVPLCFKCIPSAKKDSGLVEAPNGLIKP